MVFLNIKNGCKLVWIISKVSRIYYNNGAEKLSNLSRIIAIKSILLEVKGSLQAGCILFV